MAPRRISGDSFYYGAYQDNLRAFTFVNATLPRLPSSQTAQKFDYPGTTPSVSANGASNGIVWTVENSVPAALHAYDAADISKELFNSKQAGARDQFENNKFITPHDRQRQSVRRHEDRRRSLRTAAVAKPVMRSITAAL